MDELKEKKSKEKRNEHKHGCYRTVETEVDCI